MPQAEPAISVRGVFRQFGHRQILRDITLSIAPGEVLLLMGENGAGKTTLLRLIAGLLKPTRGTITRRGSVGLVAHDTMLYDALTARENLAFVARLHGISPTSSVADVLVHLGLEGAIDQRIATYSRGMLQRLAIARALLPGPEILLLDEPLTGLDDAGTQVVRGVLTQLRARGCAVVIATHQIAELTRLCTRVGYLIRGRLAALEPLGARDRVAVMERFRAFASHD